MREPEAGAQRRESTPPVGSIAILGITRIYAASLRRPMRRPGFAPVFSRDVGYGTASPCVAFHHYRYESPGCGIIALAADSPMTELDRLIERHIAELELLHDFFKRGQGLLKRHLRNIIRF